MIDTNEKLSKDWEFVPKLGDEFEKPKFIYT
jgi:hypothetical protein